MPVTETQLDELIARMTPAEKAGQLTQYFYTGVPTAPDAPLAVDSEMARLPVTPGATGTPRAETG